MLRQFVFNSGEDAVNFLQEFAAGPLGRRRKDLSGLSQVDLNSAIMKNGGTPWYRSHHERETFLHQRIQVIHQQDRDYFQKRVPVARALHVRPVQDTWSEPPTTKETRINQFFEQMWAKGLGRMLIAADIKQRYAGHAFLYINSDGDIGEPLRGKWHGFDYVRPENIDWEHTVMGDRADPMLPHGIEKLALKQKEPTDPLVFIHGSRLVALYEDPEARDPWAAQAFTDVIHDALWDFLDVQFSRTNVQVSGNPLVLEIDTDMVTDITDDEAQDAADMAVEVRSGHRDAFGPIKGLSLKRVGKTDLDDPEWGLRMVVGQLAAVSEFSANMIMPFSRGSRQMEPEDDVEYSSNILLRQRVYGAHILNRILFLASQSGLLPAKLGVLPSGSKWPYPRAMGPRDETFIMKGMAQTAMAAAAAGRRPPREVEDRFPVDDMIRDSLWGQMESQIEESLNAELREMMEGDSIE